MTKERGMLVRVVQIGYGGAYVAGYAGVEIGGYSGQFFRVTRYKEKTCALRRPDAAGGLSDAGGGG